MTITDQLKSVFPKNVNKAGKVFSAIIANGKDAAIETIFKNAQKYIEEYVTTPNIYDQTGEQLLKTVDYFSYLEPFDNETEKALKQRFGAIFRRSGDTVWGTPHNVKNVFREYFPSATIYLAEGTNDITENLLKNGDFEGDTDWVLNNGAVRGQDDSFSKTYALSLVSGDASQTVTVLPNKTYSLHWFQKGKISVSVTDNANRYWNGQTWVQDESKIEFETEEWNNKNLFIINDASVTEITISYHFVDNPAWVDYAQLYEKRNYHSFTIIAHFVSGASGGDVALAPGTDDDAPIEQAKYDNYGYYDSSYMTGVKTGYAMDLYNDLLNYVRGLGVRAYINICNQDYKEVNP